jgi:hypothetical protein
LGVSNEGERIYFDEIGKEWARFEPYLVEQIRD